MGCWAGRFTQGHPGPLTFTWQSVTASAMAHYLLGLSWGQQQVGQFPTDIPAPVSRNAMSLASFTVKPSPIEHLP